MASERHAGQPAWVGIPLFQGLGQAELDAIGARLALRPVVAGETLIHQGQWCGQLFIIRTGIVEISLEGTVDEEQREVTLRRLVGGECFGEMSLITGAPPSATATALTDGEVWTLSQQDFLQLALAQPELSRNISAILSERLLHTSRQQVADEPEQLIVVVGLDAALTRALGDAVAHLSGRSTLCVDFVTETAADLSGRPVHTLDDLVEGRLRAGAVPPIPGAPVTGGSLTVVHGRQATSDAAVDLPALLGRLGDQYHYVLVTLPFGHPLLSTHLLAYATRIVAAGAVTALPVLRARLAGLPLSARGRAALRLVLTEAPPQLRPTVETLDLLTGELGAPVRGVLPGGTVTASTGAVAALARWLVGQRIGLALGAGGAKGFAHLGALRVLERVGVPLDCVAGVSIGAIVGAAVAMRVDSAWIAGAFKRGVSRVFRPTLPLYSILSNRVLGAWLRSEEMFGRHRIEGLPLPFAVSAADLTEGREIVVRQGPVWKAVLASAAIPGIYPPVNVGRHWLVDGGVVNPVPVSTAQLLGADIVIAVDLSEPLAPRQEPDLDERAREPRPPRLPTNILRSRDIMMSEIRAHTLGEPSVLIKPAVRTVALSDFGEGAQFIEAGAAAAEAILPQLRERLPWLG